MADKKIEIKKAKLLLVEGIDALHFFIAALDYYEIEDIQVLDFGGITQLERYITLLKLVDNYDIVETIVVVRDAETNVTAAIDSVKNTLIRNFTNPPTSPFTYSSTEKISIYDFPRI